VCDKRLQVPITSGNFEAKISIDIQQTSYLLESEVCELILTDWGLNFARLSETLKRRPKCHVF